MSVDKPREIALKILYDINENGAYSSIAINKGLEAYELKGVDRAFITELVYGTLKWRLSIDWIIESFSSIRLKKISPWIINILRLGIYQLMYTSRVPESAACNESVRLSKKYGHAAAGGYVNAVMRSVVRNREGIKYPNPLNDLQKHLSIKYSHPEWMVREWLCEFGEDFTKELMEANNGIPDFTVRVNRLKASMEQLSESLKSEGLETSPGRYAVDALVIKLPSSIARLEAFRKGWFQVQDESSMLASIVLDPKPGELVMDICSAPGGKALHIAALMEGRGEIIARDIHMHKLELIRQSAQRLGINIITPEMYDACVLDHNYIDRADRVLVDAPCTGLGIIRRKPDIKWSRSIEDRDEIIRLQKKILNIGARYVKRGGCLVYSTCTIGHRENEDVVMGFISENPEFQLEDMTPFLPGPLKRPQAKKGYMQLFPNTDGIDGFFISRLVRKPI
ncbi:NusB antitermination factor [Anaerobacterium chartisolvens]|uniref:16S rRNA (cytosine(967)-C(5))-methyltransferase n=1 Tax=Anaerobacterium chartisolvens TaxID=1297424 RepID=A0A369B5J3_9FIRM|nr:16S rRNA (cytosine(967)-C(5))-methyltransferase RsmB [Anaerobacterium chartisolvens]RCX16782.1 NusB antitermination factor [Anaerobacterium chartisolvens]